MTKPLPQRYTTLLTLWTLILTMTATVQAGEHWFSRYTGNEPGATGASQPPPLRIATSSADPLAAISATPRAVAAADSALVFDLVVSLHTNPTTQVAKQPYEDIIRNFARAVYEESNGAHKLGKVRIFRKGRHSGSCDILWTASGHPCASAAGYGVAGKHIYMFDTFAGGSGGGDYNLLGDVTGAGYTIGHEWGHYCYGLFDEYRGRAADRQNNVVHFPWDTDTPVPNAIMNSQWNASGGNFAWLNHSTALNNTTNTAQHRVYGASCWEVLARPTSADPRDGARANLPTRTHWYTLEAAAPASNTVPAIDLTGDGLTQATNQLKIIWIDDALAIQIVIDRSGSMDYPSEKMDYARIAAKALVEVAPLPVTNEAPTVSIGVIDFDDTVSVLYPLTPIDSQATKDSIKAAIDTLYPRWGTAIGDAAATALDGLLSLGTQDVGKVVFLLSDGQSNSGIDPADVIPAYQAANVPLFTFAYGADADTATLGDLADATNGRMYYSPVGLGEIQRAFLSANEQVTDSKGLGGSASSVLPGATATTSFVVDPTLRDLTVIVSHDGDAGAFDLVLVDPNGGQHGPDNCDATAASSTLCTFTIASAAVGTWQVRGTSQLGGPGTLTVTAQGKARDTTTYTLSAASIGGPVVAYPEPIALIATVSHDLPIAGATVTAQVKPPYGAIQSLTLTDDGVAPDAVAHDGVYSALLSPTQIGTYEFTLDASNPNGTAQATYTGLQPAVAPDGSAPPPPGNRTIADRFQRQTIFQVQSQGVSGDDHSDVIWLGTALPTDNSDVAGRIDTGSDLDAFIISVPAAMDTLMVRVTDLGLGMDPVLRILDSDGTTVLAQGTLDTAATATGYLSVGVSGVAGATLYVELTHASTSGTGTYHISAGAGLAGETVASPYDFCLQDDRTGSVIDVRISDGAYRWTDCWTATTVTGTGLLLGTNAKFTLTDTRADRKLKLKGSFTKYNGSASLQLLPSKQKFKIKDKFLLDDTCQCW